MGYIKLKSLSTAKESIIGIKKEPTVWKYIFANDTSDKGSVSKIYKELQDSTPGRQTLFLL